MHNKYQKYKTITSKIMVLNTEVISDTFNVATSVNHAEIVSLSNLLTCTACQPLQTE
jgi:hypothetical protein